MAESLNQAVQSACQPVVSAWRLDRSRRVTSSRRLFLGAALLALLCVAASVYAILSVATSLAPVSSSAAVDGAAAAAAVLLVGAVMLSVAGCRVLGGRPSSTRVLPCLDTAARVNDDMEHDEGLAEALHLEFLAALALLSDTLSRRGIHLRHRWVVAAPHKPAAPDARQRSDSGKFFANSDALVRMLEEESGSFGGVNSGGRGDSERLPFFPPDDDAVVVEWVEFQLPAIAANSAPVSEFAFADGGARQRGDGTAVAVAVTQRLPSESSSMTVGETSRDAERSAKHNGETSNDTLSLISSEDSNTAVEVSRILTAARLLAEDDVVGAMAAIHDLLVPGTSGSASPLPPLAPCVCVRVRLYCCVSTLHRGAVAGRFGVATLAWGCVV